MRKLKEHLYQSLENSKLDFENPNENASVDIGGGYQAPLGKIYEAISAIETLEDHHFHLTFDDDEDIELRIITIQEKLQCIVYAIMGDELDEENMILKFLRSIGATRQAMI